MKIYIVMEGEPYEGGTILSVHKTEEGAKKALEKHLKFCIEIGFDDSWSKIIEHELED